MKTQARTQYSKTVFGVFIFILVSYIAIQAYWLTRPVYSWWDCLWNPVNCVNQGVMDYFVGLLGLLINPTIIGIVFIVWLILRIMKR